MVSNGEQEIQKECCNLQDITIESRPIKPPQPKTAHFLSTKVFSMEAPTTCAKAKHIKPLKHLGRNQLPKIIGDLASLARAIVDE
jgi:hypothetical protein